MFKLKIRNLVANLNINFINDKNITNHWFGLD